MPTLKSVTNSVTNNMRDFFAKGSDKETTIGERTKLIAELAYGHGFREGKSGGTGNLALIGGKLVKFNTKWHERTKTDKLDKKGEEYLEMKEGRDKLRQELRKMAIELRDDDGMTDEELSGLLKEIGFEEEDEFVESDGRIKGDAGLFTRVTAASVVKKLAEAAKKAGQVNKEFVDNLFNGHTPSYGNSVKAFNAQVAIHQEEVFKTLPKLMDDIVDKSLSGGVAGVRKGIADHFPEDSKIIKKWLEKTCTFLLGLVPSSARDRNAYKRIQDILGGGKAKIEAILNEIEHLLQQDEKAEEAIPKAKAAYNKVKNPLEEEFETQKKEIEGFLRDELSKHIIDNREAINKDFLENKTGKDYIPQSVIDFVNNSSLSQDMKDAIVDDWLRKNLRSIFSQGRNKDKTLDLKVLEEVLENGRRIYRDSDPANWKDHRDIYGWNGCHIKRFKSTLASPWQKKLSEKFKAIAKERGLGELKENYEDAQNSDARLGNGRYKLTTIDTSDSPIEDDADLMYKGIRGVRNAFGKMLRELSEVTFRDGTKYPDLRSLGERGDNQLAKIHKNFRDVVPALKKVVTTFNTAVGTYDDLKKNIAQKVVDKVKWSGWKNAISRHTDDYDKICNGKGKKDKTGRIAFLEDLAQMPDGEEKKKKLRELARTMVAMLGATCNTTVGMGDGVNVEGFEEDEDHQLNENLFRREKLCFDLRTFKPLKDFELDSNLYVQADKIENEADFKTFVKSLIEPEIGSDSIFAYATDYGLPAEFPIGFGLDGTHKLLIQKAFDERYSYYDDDTGKILPGELRPAGKILVLSQSWGWNSRRSAA